MIKDIEKLCQSQMFRLFNSTKLEKTQIRFDMIVTAIEKKKMSQILEKLHTLNYFLFGKN